MQKSRPVAHETQKTVMLGRLWLVPVLLSAAFVLLFLWAAARRLHFPYAYDTIEDGILNSVRAIRSGRPLYSSPSVYFTAYLYAPLYMYVCALLSHFTGITFTTLRLVSVASAVGIFAGIYRFVWLETRRAMPAVLALGCFVLCYQWIGFDGGHVDTLCLCLIMWAIVLTRNSNIFLAAFFWVLAVQTKQGVLPVAILFLCCDFERPKRLIYGVATFLLTFVSSVFVLNLYFHGWYRFYVFGLTSGLGWESYTAKRVLSNDVLIPYGVAILTIAAVCLLKRSAWRSRSAAFYFAGTLGMVVFSCYIRAHRGAALNAMTPAYLWISVVFGVAIGKLQDSIHLFSERTRRTALALLIFAVSIQLFEHLYSPTLTFPTVHQGQVREAFANQIRMIPGDVLVASHAEEAVMAGKRSFAGTESVGAVIDAPDHRKGDPLLAEYQQLFDSGTLSAVVLDSDVREFLRYDRVWLPRDVEALFPLRVAAVGAEETPGYRPKWILLPCSQMDAALRLDRDVDVSKCPSTTAPH